MSEFNDDFYTAPEGSKDLSESEKQNKYKDSNNDGRTDTGRPVVEYMTKIQAKGMILCDDLFARDGHIFSKDGTSLESLIKQVSMVKILERGQVAWDALAEVYNATVSEIAMIDVMMWQSIQAAQGNYGVAYTHYAVTGIATAAIGSSMSSSYFQSPTGHFPTADESRDDFLSMLGTSHDAFDNGASVTDGDRLAAHERDLEGLTNWYGSTYHGFFSETGNSTFDAPGFRIYSFLGNPEENRKDMKEKRDELVKLADRLTDIGKEMLGQSSSLKLNPWKADRLDPFGDGVDLTVHIRLRSNDYLEDAGAPFKFETFLDVQAFSLTEHSLKGTHFFDSPPDITTEQKVINTLQINVGEISPKHAIKALYPNGQYRYHEVKPLNDMLNVLDSDGNVESIPEAIQQINRLGQIVSDVVGDENYTRQSRFSDLESALHQYFIDTTNAAVSLEEELRSAASVRDLAMLTAADAAVNSLVDTVVGAYNLDHGSAIATFASALAGVQFDFPLPYDHRIEYAGGFWLSEQTTLQAVLDDINAEIASLEAELETKHAEKDTLKENADAAMESCMAAAGDDSSLQAQCQADSDAALVPIQALEDEIALIEAQLADEMVKRANAVADHEYVSGKLTLSNNESRFDLATWIIKTHVVKGYGSYIAAQELIAGLEADIDELQFLITDFVEVRQKMESELAQMNQAKAGIEQDVSNISALLATANGGGEICSPDPDASDGSMKVLLSLGDDSLWHLTNDSATAMFAYGVPCGDGIDHIADLTYVKAALEQAILGIATAITEAQSELQQMTSDNAANQASLEAKQAELATSIASLSRPKIENPIIWKQASMVFPSGQPQVLRVEVLAEDCDDVYADDGILCTVVYAGGVNDIDYGREMDRVGVVDQYPSGGVVPTLNDPWEEDNSDGVVTPLVVKNPGAVHSAEPAALSTFTFAELVAMASNEIDLGEEADSGVLTTVVLQGSPLSPIPSVVQVTHGGELSILRQDSYADTWNGYGFRVTEIFEDGSQSSSQLISSPANGLDCELLTVSVVGDSVLVFEVETVGYYPSEISLVLGKNISCPGDDCNDSIDEGDEGDEGAGAEVANVGTFTLQLDAGSVLLADMSFVEDGYAVYDFIDEYGASGAPSLFLEYEGEDGPAGISLPPHEAWRWQQFDSNQESFVIQGISSEDYDEWDAFTSGATSVTNVTLKIEEA